MDVISVSVAISEGKKPCFDVGEMVLVNVKQLVKTQKTDRQSKAACLHLLVHTQYMA